MSGTIAVNTTWTAANGPYNVTASLTIASGAALTIQPGTTIYLGSGVNITVANGGRLLAEGTAGAPIRFTVVPGSGVSWGGLVIDGAVGSPESRLAYVTFEGNNTTCIEVAGGTLTLDHANFLTTTHQYLALDGASFLVSNCVFPSSTAAFELVHGTGGIKAGGRGIVRDCFFGTSTGTTTLWISLVATANKANRLLNITITFLEEEGRRAGSGWDGCMGGREYLSAHSQEWRAGFLQSVLAVGTRGVILRRSP